MKNSIIDLTNKEINEINGGIALATGAAITAITFAAIDCYLDDSFKFDFSSKDASLNTAGKFVGKLFLVAAATYGALSLYKNRNDIKNYLVRKEEALINTIKPSKRRASKSWW
jgi:hypothetical protein